MAVNWAREVSAGVTSYCDRQDVRTVLMGIAPDIEGDTLEAWMSKKNADKFIDFHLESTRLDFEDKACRDFGHHEDVEIAVSGQGTEVLDLAFFGFAPLLDVTVLAISGISQTVGDFEWNYDGRLMPENYSGGFPIFLRGHSNVTATIDYGYTAVPADVKVAQAGLVACKVLPVVQASDRTDPSGIGGFQRVSFGELQVSSFQQGRYVNLIKSLMAGVDAVAARYKQPLISRARPMIRDSVVGTRLWQFMQQAD